MKNLLFILFSVLALSISAQNKESCFTQNYYNRSIGKYGLGTVKWFKVETQLPKEVGEYLVYRKENDTVDVSYWDGKKWGYNGTSDTLISHWAEMIHTPFN